MHCTLLAKRSMAVAIGIIHGHGSSNKMHPQLQPKKTIVLHYKLLIVVSITAKGIIHVVHYLQDGALKL